MTQDAGGSRRGFIETLGAKLVRASAREVVLSLRVGAQHLQPFGILHGGVHCALVESAASLGAWYAAGESQPVMGIENQTSFLKPAQEGAELIARATPVAVGRRTQLWAVEIHDQDERLLASGRVRLMV